MQRYELRLSGSGGQGIVLAGLILAEAASIYDGKYAVQTRSYGPEARGGASKSEVVISPEEIDYPKVIMPDLLFTMTQSAYDKYKNDVKDTGIIIADSFFVANVDDEKVIRIPVTPLAKEKLGKTLFANTLALGIIAGVTGIVSRKALEAAVLSRSPGRTEQKNKAALGVGFEIAKKYVK